MDTVSHALWGKGLFGYKKYRWFAVLFGAIPDLLSFGIYFIFNFLTNFQNLKFGKPEIHEIPDWVFALYDFSHSIIVAFLFIAAVYIVNKDFCFPMLAWPLHIVIDFFTHSIEFFPTPIFWPISNFRFDGIPWSNPIVWLSNIFFIVLIFIYRKKYN